MLEARGMVRDSQFYAMSAPLESLSFVAGNLQNVLLGRVCGKASMPSFGTVCAQVLEQSSLTCLMIEQQNTCSGWMCLLHKLAKGIGIQRVVRRVRRRAS